MRVLLTGSSGWLGRFLAPRLHAAGHVAIGLDVAPGANTQVVGSVADRAVVERAFTDYGIEAVVHAAALHKPDIAHYHAGAFIDVNVTGTLTLLEAAAAASHDRFVFTSTTSLMISDAIHRGEAHAAVWLDENFGPLAPRNIYGITKLTAEGLCRLHFLEHGLNCVILRAGRFFPEEDDTQRELPGPNLKTNEFLNRRLTVEDAADAHVMALDRAPALASKFSSCRRLRPSSVPRRGSSNGQRQMSLLATFRTRRRSTRGAAGNYQAASGESMTPAASSA